MWECPGAVPPEQRILVDQPVLEDEMRAFVPLAQPSWLFDLAFDQCSPSQRLHHVGDDAASDMKNLTGFGRRFVPLKFLPDEIADFGLQLGVGDLDVPAVLK